MKVGFAVSGERIAYAETAQVLVYVAPDEGERRDLTGPLGIDLYDLESALDPDEVPRLELTADYLSIIWKRPQRATIADTLRFEVSTLGLFLRRDRLVVVLSEEPIPFGRKELQGSESLPDLVLRLLLHTVRHYMGHLKAIRQVTSSLEAKISSSMENRYLLQMFTFTESLTYYLDAIEGNGSVLQRLRNIADRLQLTPSVIAALDDLLLENGQCARQCQIHSSVLSGLMDARGTVVNNNMNVLLKNLTLINIIFLPLNLIAGIGGMSEYSMMTRGVDWRLAYALFSLGMILLGWVTWVLMVRATGHTPTRRGIRRWPWRRVTRLS
jgi:magnesium transporter